MLPPLLYPFYGHIGLSHESIFFFFFSHRGVVSCGGEFLRRSVLHMPE